MKRLLCKLAFLYPRVYAFFCYYRKKEGRREFEEKVRLFYGSEQKPQRIKRIVKGIFELRGSRKLQRYLIPQMDRRFVNWFVKAEGLHFLDQALKEGRGVVLMAAHIGNPHIGINVLRTLGYDVTIIKGGSPRGQKYKSIRYSDPHEYTIFTDDTSLLKSSKERALEIIRSGRILYYSGDGVIGRRKLSVPFLGRKMEFPTGTLHLARQANAAVIPVIHLYCHGRINVALTRPIDQNWEKGEEDYGRMVHEFARLLETYIVNYPEEYMGIYGHTILDEYYRAYRSGHRVEGQR